MDCGSGFHSWSGDYGNVGKIEIRQVQHSPAMALNRLFWENMGKHSQIQKTATSSKRRSLQILQQKIWLRLWRPSIGRPMPLPSQAELQIWNWLKLVVFGAISSKNKWFTPAVLEPTGATNPPPKMRMSLGKDIMAGNSHSGCFRLFFTWKLITGMACG